MNKFEQQILALQSGEKIFENGKTIITEDGNKVQYEHMELDWNDISPLTMGKCGELYAQYILSILGCNTYEALVDDHGVDLIAEFNKTYYKIQVKAIRNENYTYIKENNPVINDKFFLMYIRVSNIGIPKAYLFPMNYIINRIGKEDKAQYICFSYHKYIDKVSHPEYGISASKKHFECCDESGLNNANVSYFCVANGWEIIAKRFMDIINMNIEG